MYKQHISLFLRAIHLKGATSKIHSFFFFFFFLHYIIIIIFFYLYETALPSKNMKTKSSFWLKEMWAYYLQLFQLEKLVNQSPSARDLQEFLVPTSRVGYHAGKPIESVVYCLNIFFRSEVKGLALGLLIHFQLFETNICVTATNPEGESESKIPRRDDTQKTCAIFFGVLMHC